MKYTYELIKEQNIVIRTNEDGDIACIPTDPVNSDYQAYLADETKTK
jgi:hypothetical protein